jgi:hypothetical protein
VAREERGAALDAREAEATAREQKITDNTTAIRSILSDTLPRLLSHLDTVVSAREEQHRQDAEAKAQEEAEAETTRQAERITDALKALPDSEHTWGELTVHPATTPEH